MKFLRNYVSLLLAVPMLVLTFLSRLDGIPYAVKDLIDVAMLNEPVPTGGHWNINDIYSPGRQASHVAIDYAAGRKDK